MKKVAALVIGILLLIVLFFGGAVWWKSDMLLYERELISHFASAMQGDGIVAEIDGVTTVLSDANTERLRPYLCRAERQMQLFHTRENTGDSIRLTVDDDMTIDVEAPNPDTDLVYIYYHCGGRSRVYSLEGYDTMKWIRGVCSVDGAYGPNEKKQ